MVHDDGAAPSHENGLTTLAICKAEIRNAAQIGDIIMGVVSNRLAKASAATDLITVEENSIVYIGTVESIMSMEEYNSPGSQTQLPAQIQAQIQAQSVSALVSICTSKGSYFRRATVR